MTTSAVPSAVDGAPRFRNVPIRTTLVDGIPHFYAADIIWALQSPYDAERALTKPAFPPFGKAEIVDAEGFPATVLSSTGVLYLTEMVCRFLGQSLVAWVRREAFRQCPEPPAGHPAMFLTILPKLCRPPRPGKYSGYLAEWDRLRGTLEGQEAFRRWPVGYYPVGGHLEEAEQARMAQLETARRAEGL